MAVEKIQTRVGEIAVVRPDDDAETVYLRAAVGTVADRLQPARFLADALEGNRFGLGTDGATLSLGSDETTVYLTLRLEADAVSEPAGLEAALQAFADVLTRWQDRLALYGREPAEEEEVR